MQRILTYQVSPEEENTELLSYLRQKGISKKILISMKPFPEAILLNGRRGYGHTLLKAGDQLRILIPEEKVSEKILPVKMDLQILYEDEDLLVINKQAGIPVHPSMGNYDNTLANAAAWYFTQKNEPFVFRCINRLDRDTSGALILAKNPYSASVLSAQMKARKIRRTYLAIAEGITPESGCIDAPISREADSTIARCVDWTKGEPAVTHYRRLATFSHHNRSYSIVEFHLDTGRTHQIRVHMKHLGHPLPGDFLYHPDYELVSRQPLHSISLEFLHPVTDTPMYLTAPLPDDLAGLIEPLLPSIYSSRK